MIFYIITHILLFSYIGYLWKINQNLKKAIVSIRHEKQSSDIIRGQIAEQIVPLYPEFQSKFDMKNLKFLGQPLDYIYFGDDKIVFIEIKTGNAKMSKKQQKLKTLIKEHKVFIEEYRIKNDN